MGVDGPLGSGRALRLDPHALPVRYAAHDRNADGQIRDIELDRDRVVLKRAVAGIRMKVGVPVNEFAGVALRRIPAEGGEPPAVAIVLVHRDDGLSVPLFVAAEESEALAAWTSWSRALGIPMLLTETRRGAPAAGTPGRRRRRGAVKWRRPSILMRRKPGRRIVEPEVHRGEREIIARS